MPLSSRARLTALLILAATPAAAQTPAAQPLPAAPVSPEPAALPDMAAVEQAWHRGEFVTVRQALRRLAQDQGSALAQYRYGQVLLNGHGGPRDLAAAIHWLQQAVAQDHLQATTLLARVYLSAPDDQRDAGAAAALLARAAPRGDREAQYYLGLLRSAGDGIPRDEVAAVNWLLAAA